MEILPLWPHAPPRKITAAVIDYAAIPDRTSPRNRPHRNPVRGTHDSDSRTLLRTGAARRQRTDGGDSGRDDVPDDGLHRLRQSPNPLQRRHAVRRGVRRHLPRGGGRHADHGPVRQLPDRAGAGHGAERLLRLQRRARSRPQVGGRAGRGLRFRPVVPGDQHTAGAALDRRGDSAGTQTGHCGRDRAVPGGHRAQERRHHPGQQGDAGHRRPSDDARAAAVPRRLLPDRGARRAQGAGRRPHRDAGRRRRRPDFRRLRVEGRSPRCPPTRRRRSSRWTSPARSR